MPNVRHVLYVRGKYEFIAAACPFSTLSVRSLSLLSQGATTAALAAH
jgi:hypothetical protein